MQKGFWSIQSCLGDALWTHCAKTGAYTTIPADANILFRTIRDQCPRFRVVVGPPCCWWQEFCGWFYCRSLIKNLKENDERFHCQCNEKLCIKVVVSGSGYRSQRWHGTSQRDPKVAWPFMAAIGLMAFGAAGKRGSRKGWRTLPTVQCN
jgi:hypothetical protein